MTPTDLIKLALKAARVLGQGQNATQQQLEDVLALLNMMMGQWARKRWLIFHLLELQVTGTGASTYTLGPGGDVMMAGNVRWDESGIAWDPNFRTNRIESAYVRLNSGAAQQVDLPVAVVRAAEEWALIPAKNVAAGFPQAVFLDTGYPMATLHVWPALSSAYELHLLILNPLVRFSSLNTDINLPDEYQEALVYNLARRIRSWYGVAPDAEINLRSVSALQTVRNANLQLAHLSLPSAILPRGLGGYNVYTDTP